MNLMTKLLVAGSACFIIGCDDDDDDNSVSYAKIRVTHASADAPLVDIALNSATVDGLSGVDYQRGSGLIQLESASYDVAVNAILADNSTLPVIEANLNFAPDMQYDIVAVDYAASIAPVVLSRADMPVGDMDVRLDVLHAHPDVPGVDIYLTTESEISDAEPAIADLQFAVDSDALPVTVPAGSYRIRITLNGSKDVVFDSGDTDLAGGTDLLVTAVPNTNGGAVSPVNLLLSGEMGASVLMNATENAEVRVVHAVADAPEVDVLAGDAAVDGLSNIAFREFRSLDLPPASYDLSVAASSDNSLVVIDAPATALAAGTTTAIYAVGQLNMVTDSSIEPLVISEDLRSVASYAKLRVVHASEAAAGLGLVDIHASTDGSYSEATRVLAGVDFKDSAVLNVPEGSYYLAVILASDDSFTPAIETMASVENGGVYSVVASNDFDGGLIINMDNMLP